MAVDVDRDGVDELLVGYTLFKKKNKKIKRQWDLSDRLISHNDAADAGDLDNDGKIEIAIADSNLGLLASANGNIIWQANLNHAQHAVIGHFLIDKPLEQQVVFVDRGNSSRLSMFNKAGDLLWRSEAQGRVAMIAAVDGWTGKKNDSKIIVYRREKKNPVMLNGKGEVIAEFPIGVVFSSYLPDEKKVKNFVQHFDMYGDGREEILINDYKNIYIYTNDASIDYPIETAEGLPNPRIYNATFYTGMQ